jgi:DNA-binding NarL/FixJ family response regulator
MLDAEGDIEVVGELESLQGIGVLDLELENTRGIDALRSIRDEAPDMHVIIYTSHDEDERIVKAAELGVDGVHDGGTSLDPAVAAKLMQHMNKRSGKNKEPAVGFSKRETQVLELLAAGKTNRKIGTTLFISESTVKFHVHAILSKLNAGNRTEAVSLASQLGLISLAASD